jgi:hypothetical protein
MHMQACLSRREKESREQVQPKVAQTAANMKGFLPNGCWTRQQLDPGTTFYSARWENEIFSTQHMQARTAA